MLYLDSEGMNFNGPVILWQYAVDDGPIQVHNSFNAPVKKTLELLEWFCTEHVCAWHLTHDWFHAVKQFNILLQVENKSMFPIVSEIADIEARNPSTHFLRPEKALDLMIYATEGKYQFLKERRPYTVSRVPRALAYRLIQKFNGAIQFDSVLFANYKKKEAVGWEPVELSPPHPDFIDIRIKFNPSASLDAVGEFVVGRNKIEQDWSVLPQVDAPNWRPYGGGWRPYAEEFIDFWSQPRQIEYATRDVEILREIHKAWGSPAAGHYNGELCICIANTRWKGFSIDKKSIDKTVADCNELVESCPINMNSHRAVRKYIIAPMDPLKAALLTSTGKATLEILAKEKGEAGARAGKILAVRKAEALRRVFYKLQVAGRLHPNYMAQGTLSDRMAGVGGLNPQGLNKKNRSVFTLADDDEDAESGDFDAFETGIAAAVYGDKKLTSELLAGVKPHASLASTIFGDTYDDILDTEKGKCGKCGGTGVTDPEDEDDLQFAHADFAGSTKVTCYFCEGSGSVEAKYDKGKAAFYASLYGAHESKLALITGVSSAQMKKGLEDWRDQYPEMVAFLAQKERDYMPVFFDSENKLQWREPKMFAESLLGFKRDFSMEYKTIKALYDILKAWPREWNDLPLTVVRKSVKGEQKVGNAAMSALIGAIFSLSSAAKRQANNHEIQASGAGITKGLQLAIWHAMQPIGAHPAVVRILNSHDELSGVFKRGYSAETIVGDYVEDKRKIVPLIGMTWDMGIKFWGDKQPARKRVC